MSPTLEADGVTVKRAPDDTDTMIVSTALEFAQSGSSVTVFANDTDVIIMLLHFWNAELADMVIRSEYTKSNRKQLKQLNVGMRFQDSVMLWFKIYYSFMHLVDVIPPQPCTKKEKPQF